MRFRQSRSKEKHHVRCIKTERLEARGYGGRIWPWSTCVFIPAARAATLEPALGFHKFQVGDVEVTAIYDGIWRKPHDPAFIKNASVDETKAALSMAGLTTDFMPIPLTVFVLKIGDRLIMCDAGSGVGQWQSNVTHLPANMLAAGIDYTKIGTIMISHFHPDHVWGLIGKRNQCAGVR
jgi:hypothetical protein